MYKITRSTIYPRWRIRRDQSTYRKRNDSLKKLTVRLNYRDYLKLMKIKNSGHIKSLSWVVKELMHYQLQHPTPLTDQRVMTIKKQNAKLEELLGNLLRNIHAIGININQEALNLNLARNKDISSSSSVFFKANNAKDLNTLKAVWITEAKEIKKEFKDVSSALNSIHNVANYIKDLHKHN